MNEKTYPELYDHLRSLIGKLAKESHDAMKVGATREEAIETIAVALMMGGGPASVYAAMAMEALDQFSGRELAAPHRVRARERAPS